MNNQTDEQTTMTNFRLTVFLITDCSIRNGKKNSMLT